MCLCAQARFKYTAVLLRVQLILNFREVGVRGECACTETSPGEMVLYSPILCSGETLLLYFLRQDLTL